MNRLSNTKVRILIIFGVLFSSIRLLSGAFASAYIINKGISVTAYASSKSFQLALSIFLDVLAGYYSEKIGYYKAIVLGALFAAINLCVMFFLKQVYMLYIAETFNVLALVLFNGAYEILLKKVSADCADEETISRIMCRFSKLQLIGILAASGLGGVLAECFGDDKVWIVSSIAMFLVYVIYTLIIPCFVDFNLYNHVESIKKMTISKADFWEAWNDVRLVKREVVLMVVASALLNFLLTFWQPLIFKDLVISKINFEIVYVSILVVQVIASNLVEKKNNCINLAGISLIGFLPLLIGSFILKNNVFIVTSEIVIFVFIIKILALVFTCEVLEHLKGKFQATAMSIITTILALVNIALNYVGSHLYVNFGTNIVILLLVVIMLVAIGYQQRRERI